jgi:hypothetical protein
VTKHPNFASGKGEHDVTEHFEEGGRYFTYDKLSNLKLGRTKNTWKILLQERVNMMSQNILRRVDVISHMTNCPT